ncbi:MAG TPA: hypothetical protein VIM65_09655 [Cyclobacteriaceae bacterium]
MKHYRSILSVAFAILVLFSSSSFMVGLHLCGGHVQKVALFTKAEGCGMEKKMPPCQKHQSKACCEDETIVHNAQDFKVSTNQISITALPVFDIIQHAVLIAEVIPTSIISTKQYAYYDPPLRPTDITVDLHTLLI